MKKIALLSFVLIISLNLFSQDEVVRIWKDVEKMKSYKTRLYVYEAPDSIRTGTAVIICPGGSYHHLGLPHEGFKTAEWFNSIGVTAFVLRYRVSINGYHYPAMLEDVQRAIQYVREHAEQYKIETNKVGVIGFSAGGHLALMAGTFDQQSTLPACGIKTRMNLQPSFVIPIYPVVSMQDSIAHVKSRKNLLTKDYTKEQQDKFSMELQVHEGMPPVFLLASKDDPVVDYRNSVCLYKALQEHQIPCKFLLFDTGGHGYGMKKTEFTETTRWNYILRDWLRENGLL